MPVGRVNDLNPDGHSGQRRLQLVVGSMLRVVGFPQILGFPTSWLMLNEARSKAKFSNLEKVSLLRKAAPVSS